MNATLFASRRMMQHASHKIRSMGAHNPPTFRPETWKPAAVYGVVGSICFGGVGLVMFAVHHQNKKHGFDVNPVYK